MSRTPFSGANELVVHVPDSGALAWARAARVLTARGYQLLRPEPAAHRLKTVPRPVQQYAFAKETIEVRVFGQYLVVRGVIHYPDSVRYPAVPVVMPANRGRNEIQAQAWDELEAVARALKGAVWYQAPINAASKWPFK
ncbi:hypothetical protein [Hymenobacter saemangeumensis]|uniref:hypothetical protein n=1 Tax=Hymenobacter saemangeumensis TaxID=1084522 RepID=UPI0031EE266B